MAPSRKQSPPSQPSRDALSRERVLKAAVRIADEQGLAALTMRGLARELGVEGASLYYYVSKKDDILDAILDAAVAEMRLPSPDGDWKAAIRAAAISANEALLRHPWAANLLLTGGRVSPARLRQIDAILGCLHQAGFSGHLLDRAYHALDSHIMGFTLWQLGISQGMANLPGSVADFRDQLDAEQLPFLIQHINYHLHEGGEEDAFAFGLELILDGLARRDPDSYLPDA